MIDATRGKPGAEQVALCDAMINLPLDNFFAEDGTDVRNYGGTVPEMRRIFAQLLQVNESDVIVGGSSSLNMMYDFVAMMLTGGKWTAGAKIICPVPGYDRHFAMCEYFGIQMETVAMTEHGPDMDAVEELAADPTVLGIWCVPVFSNPQGYVYADETVRRLATMKTAHPHFRIMWDDAYSVHNFIGHRPVPANILDECRKNGNENRPVMFTSFSKISVAGSGVACLAAAGETLEDIRRRTAKQTIGPDKVNQLRHARFFKDADGVFAHMKKHAAILCPKFECVFASLDANLTEGTFTRPTGGYFVALEIPGQAKRVREICKAGGVLLTEAGATFPYNNDPQDAHLRFAPSCLSMQELEQALEIFCKAVKG